MNLLATAVSFKSVLLVAVLSFGIFAIASSQQDAPSRPRHRNGGKRPWTTTLERSSRFSRPYSHLGDIRKPSSVDLGKIGVVPYRLLGSDSAIIFGPTQSFKTSRLVIPAILKYDGGIIASSVKDDILSQTWKTRSAIGSVVVFDPLGITDKGNAFFDPLEGPLNPASARHLAEIICVGESSTVSSEESKFWYSMASRLLYPLLLAASNLGMSIGDVIAWVDDRNFSTAGEYLAASRFEHAARSLNASVDREERQLSSVVTTLEKCLNPFQMGTERILGHNNVASYNCTPDSTLYLVAPPNRQREVGPLFGALLTIILDGVFGSSNRSKVLLVLDEAANLAPIPNLDEIISTVAAYGVTFLTVFQDVAQVRSRYGERSPTIINNHRAKIFLGAISDPETMNLAELLCGTGSGRASYQNIGSAQNVSNDQLLVRGRLRSLVPGEALVIYGHKNPTVIRLGRHGRHGRR